MDTKKLRQKILDLAIRGKLVPQDPNDEPASVLLERIKAEKKRLIKEGKIKRSKKSAKTSDTPHYGNVPFEVPNNWTWTTLGSVCNFENGFAFSSEDYKQEGTPLIRISNISDNTIDLNGCVFVQKEIDDKFLVKEGDLLIALSGATTGKMGIYSIDKTAYLNQRVGNLRIIDSSILCQEYRNIFMYSKTETILKLAYGGAQPNISGSVICSFLFPLPPLAEQQRIVTEVEHWFALIDQIEQGNVDLQTSIKQTKSKILDLAIHGKLVPQDPSDEPASELLKRINPKAEITCDNGHYENLPDSWYLTDIKSIFTINPKNKVADDVIAGFVPMTNIADGYSNEFRFESKLWGDIKKGFTHFAEGDIVVAKISPCLENRKSVIVTSLPNGIGAGTTELFVFRSQCVLAEYGLYFFKSALFINHCVGTFNGVVGQQRISKSIIESIKFPLPPISEQKRIVDAIHTVFAKLDTIMEGL